MKELRICKECGATSEKGRIIKSPKYGMLCDKCYQRAKNSPKVEKLPNYGEVAYNDSGLPICHICGRAYKKILAHVWQIHNMDATEYKKEFGLDMGKGIMCEESKELARINNIKNFDKVVKKNLLEKGKKTRFITGHKGRTREMLSEQTRRILIQNTMIKRFK